MPSDRMSWRQHRALASHYRARYIDMLQRYRTDGVSSADLNAMYDKWHWHIGMIHAGMLQDGYGIRDRRILATGHSMPTDGELRVEQIAYADAYVADTQKLRAVGWNRVAGNAKWGRVQRILRKVEAPTA